MSADIDVDNMDFELPDDGDAQLAQAMQNMQMRGPPAVVDLAPWKSY